MNGRPRSRLALKRAIVQEMSPVKKALLFNQSIDSDVVVDKEAQRQSEEKLKKMREKMAGGRIKFQKL